MTIVGAAFLLSWAAEVVLRNPRREVVLEGPKRVKVILRDLDIDPDTVLVIRGEDLLTREEVVEQDDVVEIRPVISGGASSRPSRST